MEEGDVINMGTLFGESKQNTSTNPGEDEDDDDLIDIDDRLYFPPEENEVDISKNIRDMVHVEITINSVCNPGCKGLCLRCGANLNTSKCRCQKQEKEKYSGPLRNLRSEMQKK
ncbi:Large ribosomal rna subunit accumulation protein yced-like protein [Thalictrum thalictroides]|uniref:Large ribosomal rna subunit accumulation protein yced-like protein n=1 Tax=Thalictrum thalictroides TaxID=46969 RepID=A0A7J6VF65_THATH|nr:Large ribosomal rna subunit accumulation protein yced-like protein [Thalictrum thalictroides]